MVPLEAPRVVGKGQGETEWEKGFSDCSCHSSLFSFFLQLIVCAFPSGQQEKRKQRGQAGVTVGDRVYLIQIQSALLTRKTFTKHVATQLSPNNGPYRHARARTYA